MVGLALTAPLDQLTAGPQNGTFQRWAIVADRATEQAGMVAWLTAAITRLEGRALVERQQIAALLGEWERTAAWAAEARAWFWRSYDQFPQFDPGLAEGLYQLE